MLFQELNEDMTAAIFDLDGEGCSCTDCDLACKVPEFPDEADQEFVIVEGVDGVVFIMVIIFIVGSIIFLAIIVGSTVLEKNFVRKCLLRHYLLTLQFLCHGNQITRIFLKKCLIATIFFSLLLLSPFSNSGVLLLVRGIGLSNKFLQKIL